MGELEEGANRGQDEAQARMLAEQVPLQILDNSINSIQIESILLACFSDNLIFRRGYSSTIGGWCSSDKRAKMQQGLKTW